jgi:predicted PurR-regulated permease PerM
VTEETPSPLLSPGQRRLIGGSLTLLSLLAGAAALVGAFHVLGKLLALFSHVLWPLATAGVMALILRPVVAIMEKRLNGRRLTAVVVLYGVFTLLAGAVFFVLTPPLVTQLIDLVAYLPTLWQRAVEFIGSHYPAWVAVLQEQLARPAARQIAEGAAPEAKALVAQAVPSVRAALQALVGTATFFTHLALVPVYLFFFLLARDHPTRGLADQLTFLRPSVREDVVFLVDEFIGIVEAFFRGQLLIALCMGVLLAAGFSIVGLKFGLFVGLALGILNIIPYLGTIVGLGFTLPLAFFQTGGGWQLVGLVLAVKIAVQTVEAWVLTPRIMGHQTGLHPVTIIVAIFFWGTALGGVLGMLMAIPLTAFVVTAWRLVKRKYFPAHDA